MAETGIGIARSCVVEVMWATSRLGLHAGVEVPPTVSEDEVHDT